MHPFPYDILDFCEGIGKYSNGMMIISDPGYYQVTASLAVRDNQVEIRVRKKFGVLLDAKLQWVSIFKDFILHL